MHLNLPYYPTKNHGTQFLLIMHKSFGGQPCNILRASLHPNQNIQPSKTIATSLNKLEVGISAIPC